MYLWHEGEGIRRKEMKAIFTFWSRVVQCPGGKNAWAPLEWYNLQWKTYVCVLRVVEEARVPFAIKSKLALFWTPLDRELGICPLASILNIVMFWHNINLNFKSMRHDQKIIRRVSQKVWSWLKVFVNSHEISWYLLTSYVVVQQINFAIILI